jgi:hypothetical protein
MIKIRIGALAASSIAFFSLVGGPALSANSCKWAKLAQPNPTPSAAIYGVGTYNASNVRAVIGVGQSAHRSAFAEEVDASQNVSVIPAQNAPGYTNALYAVAIGSQTLSDTWAFGSTTQGSISGTTQMLIERLGAKGFVIYHPKPAFNFTYSNLSSAVAISPNNIWAVGAFFDSGVWSTLVLHWNGTRWTQITSANVAGTSNILFGVSAVGANNIWAVGEYFGKTGTTGLIEHWNGHAWSIVNAPMPTTVNYLASVAAEGTHAWAVGTKAITSQNSQTFSEYWNGSAWSIVPTKNPGKFAALQGVAASKGQTWAVGDYALNSAILLQWNGTGWTQFLNKNAGEYFTISHLPNSSDFYFGGVFNGNPDQEAVIGEMTCSAM